MADQQAQKAILKRASRSDVNGWIQLHIEGSPSERGFQHGYLLARELREALTSIRYLIFQQTGVTFEWFAQNAQAMFADRLASNYGGKLADGSGAEILAEIEGIVEGANAARQSGDPEVTLADVIGWNAYPGMICQWFPAVMSGQIKPVVPLSDKTPEQLQRLAHTHRNAKPPSFHGHHCSAFVATGDWTADGGIVIAQETWQLFANGDAYNVILDLHPDKGSSILMQSVPGYVYSSTDFWVMSSGLTVAETSLNVNGYDPNGLPEFFRARRASQYADCIDDWCELFQFGNNGGYVNTWLLGHTETGEISAYELTLNHEERQPVLQSGYYASCNIPLSVKIRNLDAPGSGYDNILKSGARRVRFEQLMAEHKGRIDPARAQAVLADHHDLYTRKDVPSGRTICGHFDIDDDAHAAAHAPYYPWGSLDGKVTSTELARQMKLQARWGRACGTPLNVDEFLTRNPQYDWLRGHMKDRPTRPWTEFSSVNWTR